MAGALLVAMGAKSVAQTQTYNEQAHIYDTPDRVVSKSTAVILPAVEVTATPPTPSALPEPFAGGHLARGGRLGLLGNKDVMETPFSTSSYTSRMIEDWQADTVAEVLRADASIRDVFPRPTEYFNVRGFNMPVSDAAWNA